MTGGQILSDLVRALLEAAFCHPSTVKPPLMSRVPHPPPQSGGGSLSRWHVSRAGFTMASPQMRDQGRSGQDVASCTCLVFPPRPSHPGCNSSTPHLPKQLEGDAAAGVGGRRMVGELGSECPVTPDWKPNKAADGQGVAGTLLPCPSLRWAWRSLASMTCPQVTRTLMHRHPTSVNLITCG